MAQLRPSRTSVLLSLTCSLTTAASASAASTPATWLAPATSQWATATNWSTNPAYPNNSAGTTYAPVINANGTSYIVYILSPVSVDSIALNAANATLSIQDTLNLSGGTFNLQAGTLQLKANTITFAGSGALANATLVQSPGTQLDINGLLSNITLGSNLNFDLSPTSLPNNSQVSIAHGFNLNNHNITMIAGPSFADIDGVGFTGNGTITVNGPADGNSSTAFYSPSGTLYIHPGVTIQTGILAPINSYVELDIGAPVTGYTGNSTLAGTIWARDPNAPVYIKGSWNNTGTFKISNGGLLALAGKFNTSNIGNIVNNGGTLALDGQWNNTGNTSITLIPNGSLALSNLTLAAPVRLGQDSTLAIQNTVNLANITMTFDGGSGYNLNGSQLDVAGANLTGNATFIFNSNTTQGSLIMSYNTPPAPKSAPALPSKPAPAARSSDAAAEAWTSAVPSFPAPAIAPLSFPRMSPSPAPYNSSLAAPLPPPTLPTSPPAPCPTPPIPSPPAPPSASRAPTSSPTTPASLSTASTPTSTPTPPPAPTPSPG